MLPVQVRVPDASERRRMFSTSQFGVREGLLMEKAQLRKRRVPYGFHKSILRESRMPWPVWLSGLSVILCTERSWVHFPAGAYTEGVGLIPVGAGMGDNQLFFSLPHPCPTSSL